MHTGARVGTGPDAIFASVYVLGVSVTGVLAVLAVSLFISTRSAAALEPGVHVDPGSPAAKQYALPLNQAREIGHGGAGQAAGTSPSLFGAGIGAAHSHRAAVTSEGAGSDAREGAGSGVREERHRRSREARRSVGVPRQHRSTPPTSALRRRQAPATGRCSPCSAAGSPSCCWGARAASRSGELVDLSHRCDRRAVKSWCSFTRSHVG